MDPEVKNIIDKEIWRQYSGLELIASEVRVLPHLICFSLSIMHYLVIELDVPRNHGGQRLLLDQQVI